MSKQAFDQIAEALTTDSNGERDGGYSITIGGIAIRPWEIQDIDQRSNSITIWMKRPDGTKGGTGIAIIIPDNVAQANGYPDIHALRSQLSALITQSPGTVR